MCKKGKQYDNARTLSTLYTQKTLSRYNIKKVQYNLSPDLLRPKAFYRGKNCMSIKKPAHHQRILVLNWEPSPRAGCLPNLDTCLVLARGNSGVCLTV